MITLNKIFDYQNLERVTHPDGNRYYVCPEGEQLSSVTTILGATEDKTGLMEWRAWVGDKKADQIRDDACALGTLMHTHLENWMMGVDRPRGSNLVRQMATNMADVIINRGLVNINEVWAMEEMLFYPKLYAGTADLIALHQGIPAICDYKTTNKMKKRDQLENYFCQLVAYAEAHNEMFGTDIKKGVIFMVSRNLEYSEFVLEGDEFEHYRKIWWGKLNQFYTQLAESAN